LRTTASDAKNNPILMSKILSAIACNLDGDVLSTAIPLFESEKIQALEWSFDALYKYTELPEWFVDLLQVFSAERRLIGHGVFFSLFSGKWSQAQQDWLDKLETLSATFQFDHITEHFGFMTGRDFHKGAPLGVPFSSATLALGVDRLKRLQNACNCPVGLENLAFSWSLDAVKRHGEFLHRLVESIDGFIILDLHNLYCQLHNFDLDFEELIQLYPLECVREIHISGGSWANVESDLGKKIRRDTHDDSVPQPVFDLLDRSIDRCKNLKYVVLEQIGDGLKTDASKRQFRADFEVMDGIVRKKNKSKSRVVQKTFLPPLPHSVEPMPLEDPLLHQQQLQLSEILEQTPDYKQAFQKLKASNLADTCWEVEHWPPPMLETAMAIAQKWR
jgi:uncharacterized protein